MGDKLVWNKRYEIGVEVIDKEHKKLFILDNRRRKASGFVRKQ